MIKDKYYEEKEYAFGCRRPSLGDSSEPNMSDCRKKCDDTSNCNFFQFYNPSSAGASENCGLFSSCIEWYTSSITVMGTTVILTNGLTFGKTDKGN